MAKQKDKKKATIAELEAKLKLMEIKKRVEQTMRLKDVQDDEIKKWRNKDD